MTSKQVTLSQNFENKPILEQFSRITVNDNKLSDSNRTFARIEKARKHGLPVGYSTQRPNRGPIVSNSVDFSQLKKEKKEIYKNSIPEYLRVSEFYLDD